VYLRHARIDAFHHARTLEHDDVGAVVAYKHDERGFSTSAHSSEAHTCTSQRLWQLRRRNNNEKIFQKHCMGRGLELDRDRQGATEQPGVWGGYEAAADACICLRE